MEKQYCIHKANTISQETTPPVCSDVWHCEHHHSPEPRILGWQQQTVKSLVHCHKQEVITTKQLFQTQNFKVFLDQSWPCVRGWALFITNPLPTLTNQQKTGTSFHSALPVPSMRFLLPNLERMSIFRLIACAHRWETQRDSRMITPLDRASMPTSFYFISFHLFHFYTIHFQWLKDFCFHSTHSLSPY